MRSLILVATLVALSACSRDTSRPNIELIQDMMESPAIKAQGFDENSPHRRGMRMPPEGTIPVGYDPYPYMEDPIAAEQNLVNPFRGDLSPELMIRGQRYYEIHCMVCHGAHGKGDGPVASKMNLRPPSLIEGRSVDYNDGRLFHIVTAGQGLMGAYYAHIPGEEDRWAVVQYMRYLQDRAQ